MQDPRIRIQDIGIRRRTDDPKTIKQQKIKAAFFEDSLLEEVRFFGLVSDRCTCRRSRHFKAKLGYN